MRECWCNKILSALVILMGLTFSSCIYEGPNSDMDDEGYIYLSAGVLGQASTRVGEDLAPIRQGQITEGTYYLSYPVSVNSSGIPTYNVGSVDFDEIIDPSTNKPAHNGWGLAHSLTSPYPGITWSNINVSSPVFYLDNVTPPSQNPDKALSFDISSSSFQAGLYTRANDLLWGCQSVAKNASNFTVLMHHAMAMVRVEVTVAEGVYQDIDLSEATLELTNVVHEPYMYDRLTGIVTVADNPDYKNLMMADYGKTDNSGTTNINWETTVYNDGPDLATRTYISKEFILPPQGVRDGQERPMVKVTMKDKDTGKDRVFSAYIPYAMELYNSDNSTYLQTLSFIRDHILIIRCQLSNEEPRLIFFPVTVVDWIDVGHFRYTGHQVGIYIYDQVQMLIEAFKKYVDGGATSFVYLYPYGYRSSKTDWVFIFEQSLEIPYTQLAGKMKPSGFDFKFSLGENTLTITGVPGNGKLTLSGESGEATLKQIVTGIYNN